jgi:hypothetical protein
MSQPKPQTMIELKCAFPYLTFYEKYLTTHFGNLYITFFFMQYSPLLLAAGFEPRNLGSLDNCSPTVLSLNSQNPVFAHLQHSFNFIARYICRNAIPGTKPFGNFNRWIVLSPNYTSLIYNSAIFIFICLDSCLRGGLAPSSQTVGSLLRTPRQAMLARKMIYLEMFFFAESSM